MELREWLKSDLDTHRFQYAITAGVIPHRDWAVRPYPTANPVSWLVWHTARWHDVAVNLMARGEPTVFECGWADRIGIDGNCGTGFTSDQVDDLATEADPDALQGYWHAVWDETERWLDATSAADLDGVLRTQVDSDARFATAEGLLSPAAGWIRDFQRHQQGEFFVRWIAVAHTYWHLGELHTVTTLLGHPAG